MHIIKIEPYENGAHDNQNSDIPFDPVPDGYAVIPDGMAIPGTYPFVNITVEDGVVTSMTDGVVPESDFEHDPYEEIAELKAKLSSTDYKIIKCSEYQMAGLEAPYDIAALHAERQTIRDRINELEAAAEIE